MRLLLSNINKLSNKAKLCTYLYSLYIFIYLYISMNELFIDGCMAIAFNAQLNTTDTLTHTLRHRYTYHTEIATINPKELTRIFHAYKR